MNQWLADLYGTAGAEDIEKTAQAHLLNKLAENEAFDINQLSPEEIEMLAQQILMQNGGQMPQMGAPQAAPQGIAPAGGVAPQQNFARPQMASQQTVPQAQPQMAAPQQAQGADAMMKEAQAKFEEADMLGRVMAHAYTQELEKIAAAKTKTAGRFVKKASAFEKLAEEHAANILSAVGVDPNTGMDAGAQQAAVEQQVAQPQMSAQQVAQPQVEQQAQFQQALDTRALEILEQAGYDVNAIIQALQQNPGVQQ